MDAGHIRQLGTPREIYDDPADTFVATFVGSPPMNLVEKNGVLIGFRPEHFAPIDVTTDTTSGVVFPFHIHRDEYLGSEHLLYGEVGEAKVVARFPATVSVAAAPGQTVNFAVPGEYVKRFDSTTGMRLRGES
jgi:multiple sugar transport system ATP-binding protein